MKKYRVTVWPVTWNPPSLGVNVQPASVSAPSVGCPLIAISSTWNPGTPDAPGWPCCAASVLYRKPIVTVCPAYAVRLADSAVQLDRGPVMPFPRLLPFGFVLTDRFVGIGVPLTVTYA